MDGRSDLYSLGLTAHFAASGRTAVTGETTQKILVKQLTETVPSIAASRPDLPPALASAIDRCVAKEPDERFVTAEALVEAIDAAQLAEPEIPRPIRLFAGEASTLSMLTVGVLWVTWLLASSSKSSALDVLIFVVGLFAVLVTRALTTLSEARRLAVAGVHHSGAGTTAAALRAGVPSVNIPFMVDHPFWAERVQSLGAGPAPIPLKQLTADRLTDAIRSATTDPAMRERSAHLAELLRPDNGVGHAVEIIASAIARGISDASPVVATR